MAPAEDAVGQLSLLVLPSANRTLRLGDLIVVGMVNAVSVDVPHLDRATDACHGGLDGCVDHAVGDQLRKVNRRASLRVP